MLAVRGHMVRASAWPPCPPSLVRGTSQRGPFQIWVRMPIELCNRVEEMAEGEDRTFSSMVRVLVTEALAAREQKGVVNQREQKGYIFRRNGVWILRYRVTINKGGQFAHWPQHEGVAYEKTRPACISLGRYRE